MLVFVFRGQFRMREMGPILNACCHRELERVDHARNRSFERFAHEKMNVLGHRNITGDNKSRAKMRPLRRIRKKIARRRCPRMLKTVKTAAGEEVKACRVLATDASVRHRGKACNASLQMSRRNKTGLPRFAVSQALT